MKWERGRRGEKENGIGLEIAVAFVSFGHAVYHASVGPRQRRLAWLSTSCGGFNDKPVGGPEKPFLAGEWSWADAQHRWCVSDSGAVDVRWEL